MQFAWPEFTHLSYQPIFKHEICLTGTSADNQIFGYTEMYNEYRYFNDIVTGLQRPDNDSAINFSMFNFADNYGSAPQISPSWLQEDASAIERTLSQNLTATNGELFLTDFAFNVAISRRLPRYGLPGLVDHTGSMRF